VPAARDDLELVFSPTRASREPRHTIQFGALFLQIEPQRWRGTLAGSCITVYEHLDTTLSIGYGPHLVGRYDTEGLSLTAVEVKKKRKKKTLTDRTSNVLQKADISLW
jgi:hypothetical protein